jgi:predicted acyltransferase
MAAPDNCPPSDTVAPAARLASLDQFRGYTVLGMFLVNFVGYFTVAPAILKHHNTYCSYADTIMPQFLFAAGFAYRLTFVRRAASGDRRQLYLRFVRRSLALILLGIAVYLGDNIVAAWRTPPADLAALAGRWLGREIFQTLVHIAVTALWVLPVIGARGSVRVGFAVASAALHVGLSYAFYYRWVMDFPGIDGGPLGFLTWTVPMLAGAAAYDCAAGTTRSVAARRIAIGGFALMAAGYALACLNRVTPPNTYDGDGIISLWVEPPPVAPAQPKGTFNYWTMSQRAGSLSYVTFAAGLSAALYALFLWACDARGLQSDVLRTFGSNALAGYVFHGILDQVAKPCLSREASTAGVVALTAMFLSCCYVAVRALEKRGVYWRL